MWDYNKWTTNHYNTKIVGKWFKEEPKKTKEIKKEEK